MKKTLLLFIKVGIPIAIIVYLVFQAKGSNQAFADLRDHEKNWWLLTAACASSATATLLTFIRWYYLVRALGVPCKLRETLRISSMGYLFNLAPMGVVGGDVLKAVMLGRRYKDAKAKVVASVIVDRVLGLYMLFVIASAAIFVSGFLKIEQPTVHVICQTTIWLTVVGTIGIAVLLLSASMDGKITRLLEKRPVIGEPLVRLISATAMYRRKPTVLIASALMSIAVHSFFTCAVFLIALALFGSVLPQELSLKAHFVIAPLSAATGVIPLCFGPFEAVFSFLYGWVAGSADSALSWGLVVSLCYRIITVLTAVAGLIYYYGARKEVAEAMQGSQAGNLEVPEIAEEQGSSVPPPKKARAGIAA